MNFLKKILFCMVIIAFLFLEYVYYSEDEVSKNLSNALVINKLVTDVKNETSHITKIDGNHFMQTVESISTDSQYENDILNKGDNDIYKLIELKIDKIDSFLLVVYDPSKVRMMSSKAFKTKDNSGKERVL